MREARSRSWGERRPKENRIVLSRNRVCTEKVGAGLSRFWMVIGAVGERAPTHSNRVCTGQKRALSRSRLETGFLHKTSTYVQSQARNPVSERQKRTVSRSPETGFGDKISTSHPTVLK